MAEPPVPAAWCDRSFPREMIGFMMISNVYLTIFAFGMLGCVLSTPLVTWVANRVGAIDRPGPLPADPPGRDPAAGRPGAGDRRGVRRRLLTYVDVSLGLRAAGGVAIPEPRCPADRGAGDPRRRVRRRHPLARAARQAAGPGGGRAGAVLRRRPHPLDRVPQLQLRPRPARPSSSPGWGCRSTSRCPACWSRWSGSWAA